MLLGLNPDSIPCHSLEEADRFFFSIVGGIADLLRKNDSTEIALCSDCDTFYDSVIGPDYSIGNCIRRNQYSPEYRDSADLIVDLYDKSPYINSFNESDWQLIDSVEVLAFSNTPIHNNEFFYFMIKQEGILLSFPTNKIWIKSVIPFEVHCDYSTEQCELLNIYDNSARFLPESIDEFSIDDTKRFRLIGINNGSKVYREKKTRYIWYWDRLHDNHFEVFDASGCHVGEADAVGKINYGKRDSSKRYQE